MESNCKKNLLFMHIGDTIFSMDLSPNTSDYFILKFLYPQYQHNHLSGAHIVCDADCGNFLEKNKGAFSVRTQGISGGNHDIKQWP
jgi:hypothetical protein